jgi:CHASE2 domain-containing sensor protein
MKTVGFLIVGLAVLIGVIPIFFNCLHDGKAITLQDGRQIPMKCFWTAMAAIASAVPLLGVGGLMAWSRQKETKRSLGILGGILGIVVIGLPTFLIGVCAHPDASCNMVMKPALIFMGVVVTALSLTSAALAGPRVPQAS